MKRFLAAALSAALLAAFLPAKADGGDGDIYIENELELCALSERVAGGDRLDGVSVRLTADIELTRPFSPIGASPEAPFSGSFYGGGHTVSKLSVSGGDYAGFFGCVINGKIDGVKLKSARVSGNNYVSLLAGRVFAYCGDAAVTGCSVSGDLSGVCYVGGVVGYAGAAAYGKSSAVSVKNCAFEGSVLGDIYAGGIAGKAEARSSAARAEAAAEFCVSRGSISVCGRYGSLAGGICGALEAESDGGESAGEVLSCVSYADVTAEIAAAGGACGAVGGAGRGASALLEDCVAFGNVFSAALSGGLAGKCETGGGASARLQGCIAAGNVTGGSVSVFAAGDGIFGCESPALAPVRYPHGVIPPTYGCGDADGNGVSDAADFILLLQSDADLAVLGQAALQGCDMNGDGACDNLDACRVFSPAL